MPRAVARSSVSCLRSRDRERGLRCDGRYGAARGDRVAARAQRLERPLAAAERDVAGAERLDDAVRIGVERRARIGQHDARLRRSACACRSRAPRRRRLPRARRAGAAGVPSRAPPACRRRARARARALRSHVPPVLQAAPRRGADPIEGEALEAIEAATGPAGREVRLAHQPVDVVDLARAQVVARVEADVERDAGTVAGVVEPVRPARRDEARAARIELQRNAPPRGR